MSDDLAARRARHQPIPSRNFYTGALEADWCCTCNTAWGEHGCDAAVAFAALRAQEGQADPHADLSTPAIAQRAPFAYGQWRVDLTTLLDRVQVAEARATELENALRLNGDLLDLEQAGRKALQVERDAEHARAARLAAALEQIATYAADLPDPDDLDGPAIVQIARQALAAEANPERSPQ